MDRPLYAILWIMLSVSERHYVSAIAEQNPSAHAAVKTTKKETSILQVINSVTNSIARMKLTYEIW